MTAVLLSAGKATRLGRLAPGGCKALTMVGGRTMLDWWRDFFPDLVVVCRSEHRRLLSDVETIVCDQGGGPAVALDAALPRCGGPVTVIYADTWVPEIPTGDEWCAVAAARGGRSWDVIEDGLVAYRHVEQGEAALVAIGLYRFASVSKLRVSVGKTITRGVYGLADVVNDRGLPFEPVFGWQDVGTTTALASWKDLAA